MPLDPLDRAAQILAAEAVIALPLGELATRTGVPPELLAARLDDDPRFVLFHPHPLADLELLGDEGRAAYRAALERAGLSDEPAVAVIRGLDSPASPVAELLRATVVSLLAAHAGPEVATSARPLHHALRLSLRGAGTARSTILPPGPPAAP